MLVLFLIPLPNVESSHSQSFINNLRRVPPHKTSSTHKRDRDTWIEWEFLLKVLGEVVVQTGAIFVLEIADSLFNFTQVDEEEDEKYGPMPLFITPVHYQKQVSGPWDCHFMSETLQVRIILWKREIYELFYRTCYFRPVLKDNGYNFASHALVF